MSEKSGQTQKQFQLNQFQQQQQQLNSMASQSGSSNQGQSQSLGSIGHPLDASITADFYPSSVGYDELFDSSSSVRSKYLPLLAGLNQIGPDGMQRRVNQIQRMIYQNGIAYSSYGDASVRERHLQIDPLPHLIATEEWKLIEEALNQRAELLNRILTDLYGPRTLVTDGILPADVLFNHPHYNLPYHGLPTPIGNHLHFYAAELVRSSNGNWWVAADRTDSPSGCGFALENRIAISRAFPNLFRQCNIRRLASFFITLREHLTRLAPNQIENPRIAILSSGAGTANYFEDSFLARYLGFAIVQPDDLVVRSGRVMLKTLGGLCPIDVIYRRQHGNSIDPLELGGDAPGIPGILQVIRDGNVVVANAPGSGLVESPIFMAFMPRLCQALMKAELVLPGVATWWGGEKNSLELMMDRIDEIQLLPAYRQRGSSSQHGKIGLAATQKMSRKEKIACLNESPERWVGQEKVDRSSTVIWKDGKLISKFLSMRVFSTYSQLRVDRWQWMPGGLVRTSGAQHETARNPYAGGGAKDAWVISDKPVAPTTLLKKSGDPKLPLRREAYLPSRIADNLCWLGRYLERAEAMARMMRTIITKLTDESDPKNSIELKPLILALAESGRYKFDIETDDPMERHLKIERELPLHALNPNQPSSLSAQVERIVYLASTVRDRLSTDAWRIIQEMSNNFDSSQPEHCDLIDLLDIVNTLIVNLSAFSGFVGEFMTRTYAFRFLNIGRRMERALQSCLLLNHCLSKGVVSGELLENLLDISDSTLTYRSRYFANLQEAAVVDVLIVDETNPRSIAYQLVRLESNLASLPGNSEKFEVSPERKMAQQLIQSVRIMDTQQMCVLDTKDSRPNLISWFANLEENLPEISNAISNRYLVHSGPIHQLISDNL